MFVSSVSVCVCLLACLSSFCCCFDVCVCTLNLQTCFCPIFSFGVILVVGVGWVLLLVCLVVFVWRCLVCPLSSGASLPSCLGLCLCLLLPIFLFGAVLFLFVLCVCVGAGVRLSSCCFGRCACVLGVCSVSECLLACLSSFCCWLDVCTFNLQPCFCQIFPVV